MTKHQNATRATADKATAVKGKNTTARKPRREQNQQSEDGSTPVAMASELPATQKPATQKTGATLKAPRQTKAALLRARLAAPGGVSLAALMELTGWQAHTLRAALTGLRKAGLAITRRREGTDTLYAIDAAGSAGTLDDAPVAPEVASAVSPATTESKDGATEPSTTAPAESDA